MIQRIADDSGLRKRIEKNSKRLIVKADKVKLED
jgi:hypothetical protein